MIAISPDRLLADLQRLRDFGRQGPGVDRIALSEADIAARHWLVERFSAAGLASEIDRYGTVYGKAPEARRTVLVGSHTDTVPNGGWLDGALGVIYGLEIARSLREAGCPTVDVVSFQDEEGTYVPCLGAKAFCGTLDAAEVARAKTADGQKLEDTLSRHALPPHTGRLDPVRHTAYFEAHIEQGPRLEAAGCPIGVVTGIVGIRRFRVAAIGQADHAGTTPIAMRRDAGAVLIRFAAALLDGFAATGGADSVWNIGTIAFLPGAANVVPAEAVMTVEMRDVAPQVLDRLQDVFDRLVAEARANTTVEITVAKIGEVEPCRMDRKLGEHVAAAARAHGIEPMFLASGAGHDAMILGRAIPSIMMFVPSIGGRSHHVSEDTHPDDIVTGCRVMATAVHAVLPR